MCNGKVHLRERCGASISGSGKSKNGFDDNMY